MSSSPYEDAVAVAVLMEQLGQLRKAAEDAVAEKEREAAAKAKEAEIYLCKL
jgi:hypothetical protein